MLEATGQCRALLIPANPSRGRVIVDGRYLVDGVPLDQTPFAAEPEHPRRTADLRELLGDDGQLPVHVVPLEASLPGDGIIVPDAASQSDLERRACEPGSETLLAGAADFFTVLLDQRCQPQPFPSPRLEIVPPALLVCGSRASWPARRADCVAGGIPFIALADGGGEASRTFGALAVGIGERQLAASTSVQSFLSELIAFIVNHSSVKTLLIEGGATAAAIAERFGWTRFTVAARAPAGVGALRPLAANAPLVLIKPGSYPWPPEVWQAFTACEKH